MADITWGSIVGAMTVEDGGYVGGLLTLSRAHVNDAVSKGELTQAEAGTIYTQMIPAAMQNGIGFAMQEGLVEKQITDTEAGTALKVAEIKDITDKRKLALINSQLSTWSATYNSGKLNNIPDVLDNDSIETLYDEVKEGAS